MERKAGSACGGLVVHVKDTGGGGEQRAISRLTHFLDHFQGGGGLGRLGDSQEGGGGGLPDPNIYGLK